MFWYASPEMMMMLLQVQVDAGCSMSHYVTFFEKIRSSMNFSINQHGVEFVVAQVGGAEKVHQGRQRLVHPHLSII
jgi:hypothetical protein